MLVFVDCMKELPATLLLQPFNFTTLATALYGEAKRGTYEDGAIAALAIVLVGLIPVIVLARINAGIGVRAGSRPGSDTRTAEGWPAHLTALRRQAPADPGKAPAPPDWPALPCSSPRARARCRAPRAR